MRWLLLSAFAACTPETGEIRRPAPSPLLPTGGGTGLETSEPGGTTPGPTGSTPETTPETTSTSTSTSTTTGSTSGAPTVCYPGPSRAWDVCLEVVEPSPVPAEYDYPDPLYGSPQYAAPVRYLDLAAHDPGLALAPNFVLEEFAQEYKGPYAVVQAHAVERMQDLRDALGPLVVNSGYRSPDYNASIGGVTWSRHMYGDAFDIDPVDVSLDALIDACYDHDASYVGVYETHIHCDWRDDPLDPAFYDATRSAPWTVQPVHAARIVALDDRLSAPAEGWDEGEPLREWRAWAADGTLLASATGREFVPPEGAATVEVVVGRAITVELAL